MVLNNSYLDSSVYLFLHLCFVFTLSVILSSIWIARSLFMFASEFFFIFSLTSASCTSHETWTGQVGKATVLKKWTVLQKLYFYYF